MGRIAGDLKDRTLRFGIEVLRAIAQLPHESRGWVVGKQLGKSGTSVRANVWEADAAFSEADFAHKMSIARKEASESLYWLELARGAGLLPRELCSTLSAEATELASILTAVVRKTQAHIRAAQ